MDQVAEPKKAVKSVKREVIEWVLTFAVALLLALPIRAYVFEPYRVDGMSMAETLDDGEMVFSTKYDYLLGNVSRFDVIICHYPDRKENFVKRVVGLPGDEVSVQDGTLYVNGEAYDEEYITHKPSYTYAPYTLGDDEYFVLGDNRANSNDSHIIGPISRAQIVSHVRSVFFPLSKMRAIK